MNTILEPNSDFDFSKLSLGPPQSVQGGSYFTKMSYEGHDIYVQFPKCKTKQGITQTEKKYQCDLLYETSNDGSLNEWLETLETNCQKLIYQRRNVWFNNEIELNDIETAFTSCARLYKSGRQFLIRCHINKPLNSRQPGCNVYDEDESILTFNDIDAIKDIIPLLKIEGIKFSTKNFQIEFSISQIMILKEREEVKQCLIKRNNATTNNQQPPPDKSNEKIDLNLSKQPEETIDLSFYKEGSSSEDESSDSSSSEEENLEEIKDLKSETKNQENAKNLEKPKDKNEIVVPTPNTLVNSLKPNLDKTKSQKSNNNDDLEIVDFDFSEVKDSIKLKKPNEVYYEIYKAAREKAKLAKKAAVEAYLEAQNIKTRYMLDDLDESDDDENNI
jgi:hypothetical protein